MTDFFRCLSLILLGAPGAVGATGWFVNQQSVLAIGRAGAGTVVDPTDPAAAYFNPAALLSPVRSRSSDVRKAATSALSRFGSGM